MPRGSLARRAAERGTIGKAKELEPYRKPKKKASVESSKPKQKSQGLMNIHAQRLLRQID